MPNQPRERKVKEIKTSLEKIEDRVAELIGSWYFLLLHLIWFALWFLLKLDILVLTTIVSLEAIFLVIILLMVNNRQIGKYNLRDEADYRTDLKAEREIAEVKKIIKEIRDQLKNR